MKIVKAEVFVCSPRRNFVTLKITTDEDAYGIGDTTLNGHELSVASIIIIHNVAVLGLFALENITMAEMFSAKNRFTRMTISKELGG